MSEYLYHYTNLETLKLILQNKTFRLSSLSRMDDLEEGDTTDFSKLGRFVYISSWTSNPNESLLLWNYSRDNEGVRLRMKPNIFKTEQIKGTFDMSGIATNIDGEFNPGILDLMLNKNITFMPYKAELIRVTYTNLERLLKPTVYKQCECGNFQLKMEDMGVFKRVEWQDQQEWRYKLSSYPFNAVKVATWQQSNDFSPLIEAIRHREDLGYIDLPLKDDAFEDIEILCSSKMSQDGREELNKILNQYAPNAIVRNSGMRIRV